MSSSKTISKVIKHCANNYYSVSKTFISGSNIFLFDKTETPYYDFLAGYSAVNQGHCHPQILDVLKKQAEKLTITSRACYNEPLAKYSEYITRLFNYDKVLPTNTGCEAAETAVKLARAWGYMKKKIPRNQAKVLFAENNFWGRSIAAITSSSDTKAYFNYGPLVPNFSTIPYNNIEELENTLKSDSNICAFMFEPVQGEAGINLPDKDYIYNVKNICKKYNVLMIADEVQTGLGRTGQLYACKHSNIKPDILCLGKALSGGFMPVSAVLADKEVMDCILPGTHGSTFGGNPLACEVATSALNVIVSENLSANSKSVGNFFRNCFHDYEKDYPFITDVRGIGLMNAIEFENSEIANIACDKLLENNIFTKTTRDNTLRFTPPLTISKYQMENAIDNIHKAFKSI